MTLIPITINYIILIQQLSINYVNKIINHKLKVVNVSTIISINVLDIKLTEN